MGLDTECVAGEDEPTKEWASDAGSLIINTNASRVLHASEEGKSKRFEPSDYEHAVSQQPLCAICAKALCAPGFDVAINDNILVCMACFHKAAPQVPYIHM